MIRVTAKRDGFRRCGEAFKKDGSEFPNSKFTKAQLETLKKEPMLVVEEIADKEEKQAK